MPRQDLERLRSIKTLPSLIKYLKEELGWPVEADDPEDATFEYTPDELGIDPNNAAKIREIRQIRPLTNEQPWGIFWINFEPKRLPIVLLRRLLSGLAIKRRAAIKHLKHRAWQLDDLLFISAYGEEGERAITFAHFSQSPTVESLPMLKVLGWDDQDTALHLDYAHQALVEKLCWDQRYEEDINAWRRRWSEAFELRHREVIETSRELAIKLAELARRIRRRVNQIISYEAEHGPLRSLHKAFKEALIHDLSEDDFADMYAQTVTYGLLSARIADPKSKTRSDFTSHMQTNPFLRDLMASFLRAGRRKAGAGGQRINFDELGISEITQLLDDANMEAVLRDFGDKNPQEDPVIHFYELFLKEYDASKRMQRGVFYTVRPVVSYIVRSADELLRQYFGLKEGLADTSTWGEMAKRFKGLKIPAGVSSSQAFVQILDPATGTGTFLVEVIDLIYQTKTEGWKAQGKSSNEIDILWNEYVPKNLLPRLYGYEILMAPYAIAHLKLGLKLNETGYRFGSDERARIYLTNSLEPAHDFSGTFEFAIPALAQEARAVNEIKRWQGFTVILGNPPYSHLSSNLTPEVMEIVEPYKYVDGERIKERGALSFQKNLQDDYIKFIRLAERLIEMNGSGLVGMITNNSFLDSRTFRGMRRHLCNTFSTGHILDLHGSGKKNEEVVGNRSRDENVFDIMQGVAIHLWTRNGGESQSINLNRGDLMGERGHKYRVLTTTSVGSTPWSLLEPMPPFYGFVIQDASLHREYQAFASLKEIFPAYTSGMKTHRDEFAYSFTVPEAEKKLQAFCNRNIPDKMLREEYGLKDTNVWKLSERRKRVSFSTLRKDVCSVIYRPFDNRVTCFSDEIIELPRRAIMSQMHNTNNLALLCSQQLAEEGFRHIFCTRLIADCQSVSNRTRESTSVFPLYLKGALPKGLAQGELALDRGERPNTDKSLLREYGSPETVAYAAYALLHAPSYRERYSAFLRTDFPRLPRIESRNLIRELNRLGSELVSIHLMESARINRPIATYIGPTKPKVERVGWSENTVWIDAVAVTKGQAIEAGSIGFSGIPEEVWDFQIGCYQVCEKWLKDRRGRQLSNEDIAFYQKIVVAIAETIELMKEIDKVIEEHGGWPGAFQTGKKSK